MWKIEGSPSVLHARLSYDLKYTVIPVHVTKFADNGHVLTARTEILKWKVIISIRRVICSLRSCCAHQGLRTGYQTPIQKNPNPNDNSPYGTLWPCSVRLRSLAHGVIILERGGTTQYWNFLWCLTIGSFVPHVGPVLKCLLVNLCKMGVWSWEFQNENKMFSLLPRDRSQEVSLEKYVQNKVKNSLRWTSGDAKSGMITVIMDEKNVWFVLGPTWGASFSFSTSKISRRPNARFAQFY
jgi:hypothetical protein